MAEYISDLTESIPVPKVYKLPPVEAPLTDRVYAVAAPTLVLYRNGAGWKTEDGMFNFPTTAHMLSDFPDGVAEIPNATPFEKVWSYFTADRAIPDSAMDVTQENWDHARLLIDELRAGRLTPTG